MREVHAVVAMGRNSEIGFRGAMPWHLPEDLRHFKELTIGHPVIMGRLTWESLPKHPLPGRRNIVLTRNAGAASLIRAEGADTAASLEEALQLVAPGESPFVIGGGAIYAEAMPRLKKIYVTRIDADFPGADTFFPPLAGFRLVDKSEEQTSKCGLKFRYEEYESSDNQQV